MRVPSGMGVTGPQSGRLQESHRGGGRSTPTRGAPAHAAVGWQVGQKNDERFMNSTRRIGVPQRVARLALAAVGVQRPVEVAATRR